MNQIKTDTMREADETFTVDLSNPVGNGASIATGSGSCTILDDDPIPLMSIADKSQAEGDVAKMMVFLVSLSNPRSSVVTVNYATSDDTAKVLIISIFILSLCISSFILFITLLL